MSGERKYVRQVVAYANYFKDFKKSLSKETLQKIYQIFIYIMTQEQVPVKFLKSIKKCKNEIKPALSVMLRAFFDIK